MHRLRTCLAARHELGGCSARAKLSRRAVLWALKSVVIDRLSIARVASNLGTLWHTVNDPVLTAGRELLINDPSRLHGVRVTCQPDPAAPRSRHVPTLR